MNVTKIDFIKIFYKIFEA